MRGESDFERQICKVLREKYVISFWVPPGSLVCSLHRLGNILLFRWGFEVELDGSKKDVDSAILAHMALYRSQLFK